MDVRPTAAAAACPGVLLGAGWFSLLICGHHEHCCVLITSLVHVGSADLLLPFRRRCTSLNKSVVLDSEILGGGRGFSPLIRQLGADRRTRQHLTALTSAAISFSAPFCSQFTLGLARTGLICMLKGSHLWVMPIVCLRRGLFRNSPTLGPDGDVVPPRRAPLSFSGILRRQRVNNGNKQSLPPALISLPLAPPILTNNTPLIPPTLNLYDPPPPKPNSPFSTRPDKNDK